MRCTVCENRMKKKVFKTMQICVKENKRANATNTLLAIFFTICSHSSNQMDVSVELFSFICLLLARNK